MKLTDEMIRIKARENGASYGKKAELDFGAGAEWARDYYEKENSNVAEPNRYNVLGEVLTEDDMNDLIQIVNDIRVSRVVTYKKIREWYSRHFA